MTAKIDRNIFNKTGEFFPSLCTTLEHDAMIHYQRLLMPTLVVKIVKGIALISTKYI